MRHLALLVLVVAGCASSRLADADPMRSMWPPFEAEAVYLDPDAKGSISGVVDDHTGRFPVKDTPIELSSLSTSHVVETRTDAYGRYRFAGLPPGTYALRLMGEFPAPEKVVVLAEHASSQQDFRTSPMRVCSWPVLSGWALERSLFSTSGRDAHILGVPRTRRDL